MKYGLDFSDAGYTWDFSIYAMYENKKEFAFAKVSGEYPIFEDE